MKRFAGGMIDRVAPILVAGVLSAACAVAQGKVVEFSYHSRVTCTRARPASICRPATPRSQVEIARDRMFDRRRCQTELECVDIGPAAQQSVQHAARRVPLRFLSPGRYRATIWEDGATPNDVVRVEREVTASDVLKLHLAFTGGAAAILEPLN